MKDWRIRIGTDENIFIKKFLVLPDIGIYKTLHVTFLSKNF